MPKTTEKFAPESATRLTIFGTSDVVNNLDEADMSDSLNGITVRLIATKSLGDFREKIEMVCIEICGNSILSNLNGFQEFLFQTYLCF